MNNYNNHATIVRIKTYYTEILHEHFPLVSLLVPKSQTFVQHDRKLSEVQSEF